ncbi:hypothetical protein RDI58_002600 [Solanum bulbocastanum]|uniref:Uncharacterized protein n=1 Tax=Solanum bulbocastanum TaxID=147425 RepID=A0AAN8UGD2_SOLBU
MDTKLPVLFQLLPPVDVSVAGRRWSMLPRLLRQWLLPYYSYVSVYLELEDEPHEEVLKRTSSVYCITSRLMNVILQRDVWHGTMLYFSCLVERGVTASVVNFKHI